jgi:BolA family transcriptional regulator, general stress-responsive regulator
MQAREISFSRADKKRMSTETSVSAQLREKLMIALQPTRLDVVNESELHAGHRNSPGTGNSHFRILIVSPAFAGKSRIERHRLVNDLLKDELAGGIHALALATLAPGEALPKG